jgi:CheY-like chemotaxis protein
VALTAFDQDYVTRGLAVGFDACLSKPAEPRELIALLWSLGKPA